MRAAFWVDDRAIRRRIGTPTTRDATRSSTLDTTNEFNAGVGQSTSSAVRVSPGPQTVNLLKRYGNRIVESVAVLTIGLLSTLARTLLLKERCGAQHRELHMRSALK